MQTDPDKLASGNCGPAHKEDEMNKEDPTQGIPDQIIQRTWRRMCPHIPSGREISDSEGDASKVETQK